MGLQLLDILFNISLEHPAFPYPAQLAAMEQACLDRGALLQVVHILQARSLTNCAAVNRLFYKFDTSNQGN